jgi:hypothetical protein
MVIATTVATLAVILAVELGLGCFIGKCIHTMNPSEEEKPWTGTE